MRREGSRSAGKGKRAKQAALKRSPKPHVISLRVSDREKLLLEQLSQKRAMNLSAVVREALQHWLER